MVKRHTAGFSLIELMIGLAIAALLMMLALPSYSVWIADAQIRNAAESIASGMRYAQGQAVVRNSAVEFIIDTTPGIGNWRDRLVIDLSILQTAAFVEGSANTAQLALPAGATTVTFTSLGGIAPVNADATLPLTEVQVTSPVAGSRSLNVLVGGVSALAGQVGMARTGIKICDPKWPATDPKGCPT